jgi:phospholipid/cholesterol/gamma-HCH transport system substrate-binding protein
MPQVALKRTAILLSRALRRGAALAMAAVVLTSCGSWRGIANVPLPGGPGSAAKHLTLYVQMPNVLALNVNSRVRVADVYVGSVRAIELKNWIATLTLDLQPDIKLPVNTLARIGQTSLLGTQHLQLDLPPDPSSQLLKSGETIPLKNASAFPTVERTLASISAVLRGGGIPDLETIQTEVFNLLDGRGDQIRDFLTKLDTFTDELNMQREDITRAINSTDRLLAIVADHDDTLDRLLTELPPLIKHFADSRKLFTDAVEAVGRLSAVTNQVATDVRTDFDTNLKLLQRPLSQLGKAAPYLIEALKTVIAPPYGVDGVEKVIRGDYANISAVLDLTLSAIDNGYLTGTGVSGMLRALEQAWGRDPNAMVPDIRYTPNPADAPIERGE